MHIRMEAPTERGLLSGVFVVDLERHCTTKTRSWWLFLHLQHTGGAQGTNVLSLGVPQRAVSTVALAVVGKHLNDASQPPSDFLYL